MILFKKFSKLPDFSRQFAFVSMHSYFDKWNFFTFLHIQYNDDNNSYEYALNSPFTLSLHAFCLFVCFESFPINFCWQISRAR